MVEAARDGVARRASSPTCPQVPGARARCPRCTTSCGSRACASCATGRRRSCASGRAPTRSTSCSACSTGCESSGADGLGRRHDADDGVGGAARRAAPAPRGGRGRARIAGRRRAAGFPVVVGARAAALAPVPTLACAVVLDAHDDAYRQTQTPCWSAVGAPGGAVPARAGRPRGDELVPGPVAPRPRVADRDARARVEDVAAPRGRGPARDRPPRAACSPRSSPSRRTAPSTSRARASAWSSSSSASAAARLLACRSCGSLAVCEPHGRALHDVGGGLGCDLGLRGHPRVCVACGARRAPRGARGHLVAHDAGGRPARRRGASRCPPRPPRCREGARVVVGTEAVLSRVRRAPLVCFADLDDYLCAPRAHGALDALRAIGLAGRLVGRAGVRRARPRARPDAPARPPRRRPPRSAATPPALVARRGARRRGALAAAARGASPRCSGAGAAALAASLASAWASTVTEDRGAFLAVARLAPRAVRRARRGRRAASEPVRVEVDPPGTMSADTLWRERARDPHLRRPGACGRRRATSRRSTGASPRSPTR